MQNAIYIYTLWPPAQTGEVPNDGPKVGEEETDLNAAGICLHFCFSTIQLQSQAKWNTNSALVR